MKNLLFNKKPSDLEENYFSGMSTEEIGAVLLEMKNKIETAFNDINNRLELRRLEPLDIDINLVVGCELKLSKNLIPTDEERHAYDLYNRRSEDLNNLQREFTHLVQKRQEYKKLVAEAIKAHNELASINLDISNNKVH